MFVDYNLQFFARIMDSVVCPMKVGLYSYVCVCVVCVYVCG